MQTETHFMFYSTIQPVDNTVILDTQESHHAQHVLRIQKSDPITITNGTGTVYSCVCDGFENNKVIATILKTETIQRDLSIHLYVALPERDQFEIILTECTALGVEQITPVISQHCQRPWWKQSREKHIERFHSKMVVSMKQSLFPYLPRLNKPVQFSETLQYHHGSILVADLSGELLRSIQPKVNLSDVAVYIGPPGGFSDTELKLIVDLGAFKVKISKSRLRTELACIALCAQLQIFQ